LLFNFNEAKRRRSKMKRQPRTPEILKKSHSHQSKKDYSRKNKSDWFDEHVVTIDMDKDKLKDKFLEDS
tara:strand:+ start:2897 stop:3103 length:207 start_codon:yes stop_codon:yes gene_type:complete